MIISSIKGGVLKIDLLEILRNNKDLQLIENANTKNNFNPFKLLKRDFQDLLSMLKPEQCGEFQEQQEKVKDYMFNVIAHKECIISMSYIESYEKDYKFIITSSLDNYIKMWDY